MPLEPTEISGKNRPKLVLLAPIWAELAASAFVCSVLKEDKHHEGERGDNEAKFLPGTRYRP